MIHRQTAYFLFSKMLVPWAWERKREMCEFSVPASNGRIHTQERLDSSRVNLSVLYALLCAVFYYTLSR